MKLEIGKYYKITSKVLKSSSKEDLKEKWILPFIENPNGLILESISGRQLKFEWDSKYDCAFGNKGWLYRDNMFEESNVHENLERW